MSTSTAQVQIESTAGQKVQIGEVTGKNAETAELSIEELEKRIAPGISIPFKKINIEY